MKKLHWEGQILVDDSGDIVGRVQPDESHRFEWFCYTVDLRGKGSTESAAKRSMSKALVKLGFEVVK